MIMVVMNIRMNVTIYIHICKTIAQGSSFLAHLLRCVNENILSQMEVCIMHNVSQKRDVSKK